MFSGMGSRLKQKNFHFARVCRGLCKEETTMVCVDPELVEALRESAKVFGVEPHHDYIMALAMRKGHFVEGVYCSQKKRQVLASNGTCHACKLRDCPFNPSSLGGNC